MRKMKDRKNIRERSEIVPGDHIYTYRKPMELYSHHGICISENEIIHFSSSSFSSLGISSVGSHQNCQNGLPACGSRIMNNYVIQSCLDCFLKEGVLYKSFEESDPAEIVIHRARYLLRKGFGKYNLFQNNCEDFALYCKTGLVAPDSSRVGRSGQIRSLATGLRILKICMIYVVKGSEDAHEYGRDKFRKKDFIKVEVEDLEDWLRKH